MKQLMNWYASAPIANAKKIPFSLDYKYLLEINRLHPVSIYIASRLEGIEGNPASGKSNF